MLYEVITISDMGYTETGIWPKEQFYWLAAQGEIDTEPDVFNFNFNGYSGKFVIKKEATGYKAVLIPEQNLKVDFTIVITSYSIHYTKLYEELACMQSARTIIFVKFSALVF